MSSLSDKDDIARMLPAIPQSPGARAGALLEIATRVASGNDSVGGVRKMQVYFTLWLDKLLEAGVDVAARKNGQDCLDIIGERNKPGMRAMAKTLVKRLIDHGYPFVAAEGASKLRGELLHDALAHLARRARDGKDDTDPQGNTVLHQMAYRQPTLLLILARALEKERRDGKRSTILFHQAQMEARQDGASPLHVLWTPERAMYGSEASEMLWELTAFLRTHLGGSLEALDGQGRSVLDLIEARSKQDMLPELDALAREEAHREQAHVMQQLLDTRTTPSARVRMRTRL